MIRYALVALCGLWLPACASLPFAGPDALRATEVAVCASQSPLVQDILLEGKPAAQRVLDQLVGLAEALRAQSGLTPGQLEFLDYLIVTMKELAACL